MLERLTSESHVPSKRRAVEATGCDMMIGLCQGTFGEMEATETKIQGIGEVGNEGNTLSSQTSQNFHGNLT